MPILPTSGDVGLHRSAALVAQDVAGLPLCGTARDMNPIYPTSGDVGLHRPAALVAQDVAGLPLCGTARDFHPIYPTSGDVGLHRSAALVAQDVAGLPLLGAARDRDSHPDTPNVRRRWTPLASCSGLPGSRKGCSYVKRLGTRTSIHPTSGDVGLHWLPVAEVESPEVQRWRFAQSRASSISTCCWHASMWYTADCRGHHETGCRQSAACKHQSATLFSFQRSEPFGSSDSSRRA
jgi:hypothetical protein